MPDQLFPPLDTLPTPDLSMEDTPATMERERLMHRHSTTHMDMVLVLDLFMEDTPPTPDQLFPAMLDQLFPPLDTLPTPDQFMEDTPATMERERLSLRLILNTLDTLDFTPAMPDQLFPAMPDQLFPAMLPQLSPTML